MPRSAKENIKRLVYQTHLRLFHHRKMLHIKKNTFVFFLLSLSIFTSRGVFSQPTISNIENGLPAKTKITKLGDEVFLNGVPTLIVGIAVPMAIKDVVKYIGGRWSADGWKVNIDKDKDLIMVVAIDENYQKVASLTKTGEDTTEGSISLTDFPRRLRTGEGKQLPVAEHLIKPVNTIILNEVRIRDIMGESITTTMTNDFNVEQNVAFYQERMMEQGWKQKKNKTIEDGRGVILILEQKKQEATFTFVRTHKQTFVTVNWINR
jgi:hypothetical protein